MCEAIAESGLIEFELLTLHSIEKQELQVPQLLKSSDSTTQLRLSI
jgi:hypothetical protein